MSESEGGAHQLKRTLGAVQLIALGIGAIIGAGLFSLTGLAAAQNSGPAVTLSMVIAAVGCAFAGLCYSEFSCMIPVAGSAYTYAYATLGEWIAWIIGWDLVIEYAIGSATVSISWSGLRGVAAPHVPHQPARAMDRRPVRSGGAAGRHHGAGLRQPPRRDHRLPDLAAAHARHQGIGAHQCRDRRDQAGGRPGLHRRRLVLHQSCQLSRHSFRPTPASSALSASAA